MNSGTLRSLWLAPLRAFASLFFSLAAALVVHADIMPIALDGQPDPRGQPYSTSLHALGLSKTSSVIFYPEDFFFPPAALYRHTPGLRDGITDPQTVGPDGATFQLFFGNVDVNSRGDGSLAINTSLGRRVYLVTLKGIYFLAFEGETVPGDGVLKDGSLDTVPSLSDNGEIAFHATTTASGEAIILLTPKPGAVTPQLIAKLGDDSLDGGHFTSFGTAVSVTAPTAGPTLISFIGNTNGAVGQGLYFGTPGHAPYRVAPGNPLYRLNNQGQVVFVNDNGDLCRGTIAGSSPLLSVNDPAPNGGMFTSFGQAGINDRGDVVFTADVDDGMGNASSGIFVRQAKGTFLTVALSGVVGSNNFPQDGFTEVEINNAGLVKFLSPVDTFGRQSYGMFIGDGIDIGRVARTGDLLLGSPIVGDFFNSNGLIPGPVPQLPGHGSFNERGQIAFRSQVVSGRSGVFVFTPSGHWRTPIGGLWDVAANWTFGLVPSAIADSVIDFDTDVVVTGPAANATVNSLQLGGGTGNSTLVLQPGVRLTATRGISVLDHGILKGTGTLAGAVTLNTAATIALELRGRTRGTEYDFVSFTGPVTFGGNLTVTAAGAFAPALGDTFDLFDFRVHSHSFANVTLPALSSGALQWDQSQLTTTGKIGVVLVRALPGAYAGRIAAVLPEDSGPITLTIQPNGAVKGKGTFAGKAFSFAGALSDSGAFTSAPIDNDGHIVTLQVDFNNVAAGSLSGTIQDSTLTTLASFAAQQTPTFTAKAPSPVAGVYTLALPADPTHTDATYPQGTGYAVLTVAASGHATLAGTLGDGTKFSYGGMISAQRELAVFVPLYKPRGFLSGQIVLTAPGAANAVTGTLHWDKPVTNTPQWYPAAFAGDSAVMGSGFEKPPVHPKLLDFPNGGAFTITGGNVPALAAETLSIDLAHRNAVTFTPAGPTAAFAGPLLNGRFPSTIAGKAVKVSFQGVVLQKQNVVAGYFKGAGQTGSVSVVAK